MSHTGARSETLSPEELYDVVARAASQDPAQVQASTTRLKEIIQLFGAYDTLHEIAAQRTVPLAVRQQSIIQFKNAAVAHWKSRKYLSDEQRTRIRARCLALLDEPDDVVSVSGSVERLQVILILMVLLKIADCNEYIIGRIARHDFPLNWPNLVPDLMEIINFNLEARYKAAGPYSAVRLRRSLETLNAIAKEMGSAKLPSGVKAMGSLVEQLQVPLQNNYITISTSFMSINPSTINLIGTSEDLLFGHLLFKCIVKVAVWTWNRVVNHKQLFQASALQLRTLSELRIELLLSLQATSADVLSLRSVDILTRHVRLFGKFFRRLQQLSIPRFVKLPMCTDLVLYYWSKVVQASDTPAAYIADTASAVFPVRFLVQAMVLFKESLPQWAPVKRDGTQNAQALSKEFVEDAVRLLVTRFIPLNPEDLEEWMADPEGWVNVEEQDNEQWVFEVRPCAERVLMTLANNYAADVVPLLETTFKQVVGQHPTDLPGVIQREALYCAIGRCAHRMKKVIPFEQWLSHTLVPEAQEMNPSYPILKRRIAWLIGKWISDMCYPANNPTLWQILLYLLQDRGPGTDEVVRLTAAISLRECVDSLEFEVDTFAPFLAGIVSEMVRLIGEAETLESKRRISSSLNTIIERAGTRIVPLVGMVAEPLPHLWTTAGEDWLFKSSLLETLTNLIKSSKEHSVSLSNLVVPLVRDSFSPGAQQNLDEDALILWQAALRDTITIEGVNGGAGLIDLFPLAISLQSENLDLLGKIMNIIESYILLDALQILQRIAVDMFRAFLQAMNQATEINVMHMATSLTLIAQVAPSSQWGEALHVSGLFAFILKILTDEGDKASTALLTECIYLLARMAISDKQMFLQLMSATAQSQDIAETKLWEVALDQWWTRFDNMSEPRLRKLAAMGIATLVSTGRPEVLGRLSTEICNLWLDVFSEIKESLKSSENDSTGSPLTLYWDKPLDSFYQDSEGTLEYQRRKALFDNDPVRTTQLTEFIAARVQEAEVACGGSANLQTLYLSKADPLVLKQIQAELIGR
ncbi:uncharacterized protein FIBRA_06983 [Fibroporia radiculosa]|uniref:Importin N-terminal domain-containing protein n=1 Tax=Fibroporia radiculosa TaxID=599839 RepID=J4GU20_9APHY|nr:uncharacterized protein FIBRA_06983 [Fibroporia radiculosa]CCM04790.1 predicted protein [Fibroporia radiculosa]